MVHVPLLPALPVAVPEAEAVVEAAGETDTVRVSDCDTDRPSDRERVAVGEGV